MRIRFAIALGLAFVAGAALAKQLPPVVQHLGPYVPTPGPTPEIRDRIRLITALTVQNKPGRPSVITFEATDFGRAPKGKEYEYRTLASELYSLSEPKKAARALADQITFKIRDLEKDLLEYVQIMGPPRRRESVSEQGGAGMERPR
jgi:hypothetical protein